MRILQHRTLLATIALGLFLFVANASALSFAEKSIIRLKASVNLKLNLLGIERGLLVLPPPPITVSVRVNVGSDDAEQNLSTGAVTVNSNDLELINDGVDQIVGLRFNNISIPPNAVITNAYLEFQADASLSGTTNLTIKGQDADNPTTFITVANNISTRPKTTASVAWSSLPAWSTGTDYQSPDITTVVQEIVSRPGWASGNSMVMLVEGSGRREAESYEGLAASAPLLVIQYDYTPAEICSNGIDDDSDGLVDGADPDCATFCPTGSISFQRWTGIGGTAISDLTGNANYPNSPTQTGTLTSFDGPDNIADNYGTRVRGFLSASQTGLYTFNLTSDDAGELYLSTSAASSGKVLIATVSGWTNVTEHTKYAAQTSANVPLVAGRKYYIELLQKEGGGGDHFQVYWKTPSNSLWTIIPGSNLCTFSCIEICNNGQDDDGDGLIDCADSDCTVSSYANAVYSQVGVVNPNNALGAPNDVAAQLYDTNDQMVLDFGTIKPAGTTFTIRWRRDAATSSNPTVSVEQSSNGATFTTVAGSPFTFSATTFFNQTITVSASTRYLRFINTNAYNTDLDAVAVSDCFGENCTNGVDDDGDGLVDCADGDCSVPTASISGTNSICTGASTTLTASGGGTYSWSTGATTAAITVSPASTTTYTVTVTSTSGCTATSTRTVTVSSFPTASISGTNSICTGASTTLTASGGGTYSWSTGATTAAITVSPASTTTYTVTVTNTGGCTATSTRTVTVNSLPTASISGTNTICSGSSTTLTASGGGTYTWNTGATTAAITVSPASTTTYTVTVTNASGCTATSTRTVTVNSLPAASVSGTNAICTGGSTTLTASGGGTYSWNTGATTAAITVSPASTTTYTVTVTNASGCTATATRTVTVNSLPTASISGTNTICSGSSTTLTASGGGTYSWSTGATTAAVTVSPASTTTYTVTVTNASGCTANATRTVTVNALPSTGISGTNIICSGGSTTLTAGGGGTYSWSTGATTAAITVSPASTTTYTVTVTNTNGCTAAFSRTVTVNSYPTANISGTNTICSGGSATLTASGGGTYAWSTGATTAAITVNPIITTTYTVTVTNTGGCTATATRTVTLTTCAEICNNGIDDDNDGQADCDDSQCGPNANAGSNVNICTSSSTLLTAAAFGGVEPYIFSWSNGLGAGASHLVSPASTTTYYVTVTSASGCTSVDDVVVTVVPCPEDCTDGIDNDSDGLIDCDDPDCQLIGRPQLADDMFETCPGAVFTEQPIFNDNNLQNSQYSIYQQPVKGNVSINQQGVFIYTPSISTCGIDSFMYQACNVASGCCDQAKVILMIGDNEPPEFKNLPADIYISCDEPVTNAPLVYAVDDCPGIFLSFEESDTWENTGSCQNYTIIRTWEATDNCGNSATGIQTITVEDLSGPEIFRVYTLSNGKKLLAGIVQNTTTVWQDVKFPINFDAPPLVFSQVVSTNDAAPIVVRQRNVNLEGFEMKLQEEEAADGIHAPESVAWMAVEEGAVADNSLLETMLSTDVSNSYKTLSFGQSFAQVPVFLACAQTTHEDDPFGIRHNNPTSSSIQVKLEEEQSANGETTHTGEDVAWLAVNAGDIVNENDDFVGVAGKISLSGNWQTINLGRSLTKPVVLFGGQPTGNDPATIRVRNVTGSSFEVRIEEWDYLNGNFPNRTVSYLVVEGSVPARVENHCAINPVELLPDLDVFAVDNCDDYLAFDYSKESQISSQGELTTYTWSALDDCGNETKIARIDTCLLAAVALRTGVYGAFIGNNNNPLMRDNLRTKGLLPLTEPYSNLSGFYHKGAGGGEETTPAMLAVTGDNAIVDWVFIEIRDEQEPLIVLATSSALLQRDGDIVTAEGDPVIFFQGVQEGAYYVSIRHRNHLGLMFGSAEFLTLTDPPLLDFKLVNEIVNGGSTAGKILNNTRCMWSGDLNSDSRVIYQGPHNDVFTLFSEVMSDYNNVGNLANFIKQGYLNTDINMDGYAIYQGPNNDRSMLLLNTILSHPTNTLLLANFIAAEILP